MYFVVFAAFAIALALPEGGPPWWTIRSSLVTWLIVLGYVSAVMATAAYFSRLVKVKLEREPSWLPSAQERLAQANSAIRTVLIVGFASAAFFTDWSGIVRQWHWAQRIWGLDELVILAPFFVSLIAAWVILFPADKAVRQVALELRLWAAAPARPVWSLRSYLSFMIRQHVLIIALPMTGIVIANDLVEAYGRQIRQWTGVPWATEAVLVILAGLVFLLAPVMLRYVWHTRLLPPGELRDRLERLCGRIGLRYRAILIWESDGMVVNAAVMGLIRPVRYIMLSDGLLEMMDDAKIEAVFGHEAGHVKCHHITFYLMFAILSMLLVGGLAELVVAAQRQWPEAFPPMAVLKDYMQIGSMGMVVAIWLFGFGYVSRRFEWQADLFGARSVTPLSAEQCRQPCFYHRTTGGMETMDSGAAEPADPVTEEADLFGQGNIVCATGATIFAEALARIAAINGIPAEAKSWRHSSIGNRIRLLRQFAYDPEEVRRFERTVRAIKWFLFAGTLIGCAIGAWLYWPF